VSHRIEIVPYRASWPEEFRILGHRIRQAVGNAALAIHHIGSTSVPGLDAKDVLDIQVTVENLQVPLVDALEGIGFRYREGVQRDHCPPGMVLPETELEKRFYKMFERPVQLHVRVQGRFNQRYALLCRDYLRTHPMAASAYAEIKRQLARYFPDNQDAYYDIKDPAFDIIMSGAFEWAEHTHWQPAPSDA
jgi:GrpB-like predicted nucleotidyltransferase (UPF0157 family)